MFSTVPHDLHRMRRAPLSPFFSKRSVSRLEPIIRSAVEQLCKRIEEFQQTGEPLILNHAFSALTIDIIMDYSYARSYNCLAAPDFSPVWFDIMTGMTQVTPLLKQFGFLLPLMRNMPESLVAAINPPLLSMVKLEKVRFTSFNEEESRNGRAFCRDATSTQQVTSVYFLQMSLASAPCSNRYI